MALRHYTDVHISERTSQKCMFSCYLHWYTHLVQSKSGLSPKQTKTKNKNIRFSYFDHIGPGFSLKTSTSRQTRLDYLKEAEILVCGNVKMLKMHKMNILLILATSQTL